MRMAEVEEWLEAMFIAFIIWAVIACLALVMQQ